MHPNPHFHTDDTADLMGLVKAYPLALIIAQEAGHIRAAHTPILIDSSDAGVTIRFHLANNNPTCRALVANSKALIVVTGPNDYISPDWYDNADQVPTWNYLSAEAEGIVRSLNNAETSQFLDDLSDTFEATLAPKPIWKRSKMTEGKFESMQMAITGFTLVPERFEGIRKLSQNKPTPTQETAAKALQKFSPTSLIAPLMAKSK